MNRKLFTKFDCKICGVHIFSDKRNSEKITECPVCHGIQLVKKSFSKNSEEFNQKRERQILTNIAGRNLSSLQISLKFQGGLFNKFFLVMFKSFRDSLKDLTLQEVITLKAR